jgi:hypothetical protein
VQREIKKGFKSISGYTLCDLPFPKGNLNRHYRDIFFNDFRYSISDFMVFSNLER